MNPSARCSALPWQMLSKSQQQHATPTTLQLEECAQQSPAHLCCPGHTCSSAGALPGLCPGLSQGIWWLGEVRITLFLCLVRRRYVGSMGCACLLPWEQQTLATGLNPMRSIRARAVVHGCREVRQIQSWCEIFLPQLHVQQTLARLVQWLFSCLFSLLLKHLTIASLCLTCRPLQWFYCCF